MLTAAVFGNTLWHGFVWDDTLFVPDGEVYRSFDLAAMFFSLKANGLEYLPVRDLSYALDCAVWGTNPAGFHFSNLVYYWLSIISVYFLTAKLAALCNQAKPGVTGTEPRRLALITAALFAVHPIHSEPASFITCRNALLSSLFLFLACTAWLHCLESKGRQRLLLYGAALLCCLLSLFAKATGIILPLLLLAATWLFHRPLTRRHWLLLAPFFALSAAAFLLFTEIARRTDVFLREPVSADIGGKLVLAVQIPLFYAQKLLFPFGLSADYGTEQFELFLTTPKGAAALLLLALLVAALWRCRDRDRLSAFAITWFLIALIPVLHLFPTIPVVADRYAYLPSFGFCLLLAATGARLPSHRLWYVLAPLLLVLALLTWQQNRVWKSDKTLWEGTLAASPRSTTALAELGRIYFREEKDYPKAFEMYRRASEINPRDPAIDLFLGHLAMMKRDYPGAIAAFRQAQERDDNNIEAVLSLGRAYEAAGDTARAKEQYRRAIALPELDPRTNMRGRATGYLQRLEGK